MVQVHGDYIVNKNIDNKSSIRKNKNEHYIVDDNADSISKNNVELKKYTNDTVDGWTIIGKDSHVVKIDYEIYKTKPPSFSIASKTKESYFKKGGLFQYFGAKKYRNKKVRISGYLKRKNTTHVEIALQAGGESNLTRYKQSKYMTINLTKNNKNNTHWEYFELIMHTPKYSKKFNLNLYLRGEGRVWFDDLKFEIIDSSIPEKYDHIDINGGDNKIENLP